MIKLVDLARQERGLESRLRAAVGRVVRRRDFILGGALGRFERAFARKVGARHAVGTGSGGAALELALRALGVGPGDEVITQPNSHASTAFAVARLGARPVFADVRAGDFQLDPGAVRAAVTRRTRAVLPVHLYGYAAPMAELREAARGLPVVEDAAHAHGTLYRGRPVGSLGELACFSFYPGKTLGAWGDAGAVTTSDARLAGRVRLLRTYGDATKNLHTELGMNSRLDTLQAAVLEVKLARLERWRRERERAALWYDRWLRAYGAHRAALLPPLTFPGQRPSLHLYVVRVPAGRRDALRRRLAARGVETGVHYPVPIHLQPVFRGLGLRRGAFPVAEELARTVLSLPLFGGQTEAECRRVARELAAALGARP